eukprot:scaffold3.g6558.t1
MAVALFAALVLVRPAGGAGQRPGAPPPLGWNSWNTFGPSIDEQLIKDTADLMVSLGLRDAGYEYLILDDAWSERNRTPDGKLVGNYARFPSGMKALGDYFGIYSDAGPLTCESFPGSRGHEGEDAATWASWGVDYLKYDNCFAPASDWVVDRYTAMRDALNKTGRPIVFSMCEWGVADVWQWGRTVGNSWRTTADIDASWDSILVNLDNTVGTARFAGPGGWNDPDMLEVGVGNKLMLNEERAHFALWALLKSPLLVGADLRRISPASLAVLKAREVIGVNQDALGVAGDLIWKQGAREVYAAPLSGGARAVVLLNRHTLGGQYPLVNITVWWAQLGYPPAAAAVVRDLWAGRDLGTFTGSFTGQVDVHDAAALRITPVDKVEGADGWRPWQGQPVYAEDENEGPGAQGRPAPAEAEAAAAVPGSVQVAAMLAARTAGRRGGMKPGHAAGAQYYV